MHVATVHWRDDRWVEPQLRHLRQHLPEHRTWAAVDGIPDSVAAGFDVALELEGSHPEKLNALADLVAADAAPEDLLLFIDGDAFPIAPLDERLLAGLPLAAVRRDENLGDPQPHPCCCLTTVGYWREIGGDWRRGHEWVNSAGESVTDTGGNLLGTLEARGDAWRPLLRSNTIDLHPLWFGIYADVVYHHGAGFRTRRSRVTSAPLRAIARERARRTVIPEQVPVVSRLEHALRYRLAMRRLDTEIAENAARELEVADRIAAEISAGDDFLRLLRGA